MIIFFKKFEKNLSFKLSEIKKSNTKKYVKIINLKLALRETKTHSKLALSKIGIKTENTMIKKKNINNEYKIFSFLGGGVLILPRNNTKNVRKKIKE